MKNQYFLKDKKALIYQVYNVKKSGFATVPHYAPRTMSALWCYASQLSQRTVFEAKQFGEDETRFFVFNQGTEVKLYDAILYRGKWYEVTRVDTTDDYNTDVFVYVADVRVSPEKVHEYGWTPDEIESN